MRWRDLLAAWGAGRADQDEELLFGPPRNADGSKPWGGHPTDENGQPITLYVLSDLPMRMYFRTHVREVAGLIADNSARRPQDCTTIEGEVLLLHRDEDPASFVAERGAEDETKHIIILLTSVEDLLSTGAPMGAVTISQRLKEAAADLGLDVELHLLDILVHHVILRPTAAEFRGNPGAVTLKLRELFDASLPIPILRDRAAPDGWGLFSGRFDTQIRHEVIPAALTTDRHAPSSAFRLMLSCWAL